MEELANAKAMAVIVLVGTLGPGILKGSKYLSKILLDKSKYRKHWRKWKKVPTKYKIQN